MCGDGAHYRLLFVRNMHGERCSAVRTFVFLKAIRGFGVGNRVIDAAVLPSVVAVADTFYFITASLTWKKRRVRKRVGVYYSASHFSLIL